jgi:hypothetical protein
MKCSHCGGVENLGEKIFEKSYFVVNCNNIDEYHMHLCNNMINNHPKAISN